MMNKYLVEAIGTFFLVLTIGTCVVDKKPDDGVIPPLAIGSVLMVMVYAGGHVSGAHYNPAVTLAVWLRGRCPTSDVAGYMIAQGAGALVAAIIVRVLKGSGAGTGPANLSAALLAELLYTFALAYVVLNVATAKSTSGNSYYGLAIGFTVLAGAFAVGGISGGVFNPAVALGITVMGLSPVANIWVYLLANFVGGALAGVAFKQINPQDP
jgi:aquaporin Z